MGTTSTCLEKTDLFQRYADVSIASSGRCLTKNISGQETFFGIRALYYKHLAKKHKKSRQTFWRFLLLDTFKATFCMKSLSQWWTQSGLFSSNRAFLSIFNTGQKRPHFPPSSSAPVLLQQCLCTADEKKPFSLFVAKRMK